MRLWLERVRDLGDRRCLREIDDAEPCARVQRGTALLTTSKTPSRIQENFDISALPEDAMKEISEGIKTRQRFNAVVETGVPGFIPRGK